MDRWWCWLQRCWCWWDSQLVHLLVGADDGAWVIWAIMACCAAAHCTVVCAIVPPWCGLDAGLPLLRHSYRIGSRPLAQWPLPSQQLLRPCHPAVAPLLPASMGYAPLNSPTTRTAAPLLPRCHPRLAAPQKKPPHTGQSPWHRQPVAVLDTALQRYASLLPPSGATPETPPHGSGSVHGCPPTGITTVRCILLCQSVCVL